MESQGFVDELDFVTSPGYLDGGASRAHLNVSGRGPAKVITDLGVLEPDAETSELTLTALHPGVRAETVKDATGWPLKTAQHVSELPGPTNEELAVLRELKARTAKAHGETT